MTEISITSKWKLDIEMNSSKLIQYALFGGVLEGYFFLKEACESSIYMTYISMMQILLN